MPCSKPTHKAHRPALEQKADGPAFWKRESAERSVRNVVCVSARYTAAHVKSDENGPSPRGCAISVAVQGAPTFDYS